MKLLSKAARNVIGFGAFIYIFAQLILAFYHVPGAGFGGKTFWDWLDLLIIPIILAIGAFLLNRSERENDRQRTEARTDLERKIATDRHQEAALQVYIDRMADLLLKEKLRTSENQEVRNVAAIRTLTLLRGLDKTRKGLVLRFLIESELVKQKYFLELIAPDLLNANLQGANLTGATLQGANLQGADLSNAILIDINLTNSNLQDANLQSAHIMRGNLQNTNMQNTNLKNANLEKGNLINANLRNAKLKSTY